MLPAGLSMLWESTAPAEALSSRFGFENLGAAARWCADTLAESWGVAVRDVARVVISSQNAIAWAATDAGDVVVKWSRDSDEFARLDASARLLRVLADRGAPVARPVSASGGHERLVVRGPGGELSVAVLPELAGQWLDVNDLAAVHAAGACLAQLHAVLASVEADPALATAPLDSRDTVSAWATDAGRDGAAGTGEGSLDSALRRLGALLDAAPELDAAPQLVHNDFRAANLLTSGSTIVGVLDFDDVLVTQPVYDLAKASVYLGTLFHDWGPTPASARAAFRDGYASVRRLTAAEAHWLEILTLWLSLLAAQSQPGGSRWLAGLL